MNIADLSNMSFQLQAAVSNIQQYMDTYFDMYLNTTPMYVTVQNVDLITGEVITMQLPNWAMMQLRVAQFVSMSSNTTSVNSSYFLLPTNTYINGNLNVNGTTITLDTQQLNVGDAFVYLNTNMTSGTPLVDAGIIIERGSESNVELLWNETIDAWQASNGTSINTIVTDNSASTLESLTLTGPIVNSSQATTVSYVQNLVNNVQTELNNASTLLQTEISNTSSALQTDLANLNTTLQTELAALNTEMNSTVLIELSNTSSQLQTQINNTSSQLQTQFTTLNGYVTSLQNQISALSFLYQATSSGTNFQIVHNLNSMYVNVTCYNMATNTMLMPNNVSIINANTIDVTFGSAVQPAIRVSV